MTLAIYLLSFIQLFEGNRDSTVNTITTSRAGRSRVRIPAGDIGFSLFQNVQTTSGAPQTSHSTCIGAFSRQHSGRGTSIKSRRSEWRCHNHSHPYTPPQRRLLLTNLFLCSFICVRMYVYTYVGHLFPFIYSFIYRYIHSFIGNIHLIKTTLRYCRRWVVALSRD